MKTTFKDRLGSYPVLRSFASAMLTIFTMLVLRVWLGITAKPFDVDAGWKPLAGWMLIFFAFSACYDRLLGICRPNQRPLERTDPDPYTLAQTEIEVERKLRANGEAVS